MVQGDLTGAFAKLARAEEHVEAVTREIRIWSMQNKAPITHQANADKTEHRLYITFRTEPDLIRWGLIAGEVSHALRSALDHCVWEAAQIEGLPGKRSREFPIFRDHDVYVRQIDRKLAGVKNPEVLALIEQVQPWQRTEGPDDHPLWVIHELDRIDKHQTLSVVPLVPHNVRFDVVGNFGSDAASRAAIPPAVVAENRPIQNHALFLTVYTPTPPLSMDMRFQIQVGFGLEFGGTVSGGVSGSASNFCKYVRGVVEQFRDCLA